MDDHDQRFKTLLKEFLPEFFGLFFPDWAALFDFRQVEWLDKEVFADPPRGQRRILDLVAKLRTRRAATSKTPSSSKSDAWVSLIHVEVESADRAAPLRERLFHYYTHLRAKHHLPVLPIAVYLRVGLQGLGIDVYVEQFQNLEVVKFQYLYLGLPQLDALEYLEQNNALGVALSVLMRVPKQQRPWLKAEALRRLITSQENEHRRFLLAECVQAYLPLTTPAEQREFQALLATEPYEELPEMAATWFDEGLEKGMQKGLQKGLRKGLEQGLQKGLEQGLQKGRREGQREGQKVGRQEGLRQALLLQLESRFGKLRPQVEARLAELSERQLTQLVRRAATAESLAQLGLAE